MTALRRFPRALAAVALTVGACSFDPRAPGGAGAIPDGGGSPEDDGSTPVECPEDLHTVMTIGGRVVSESAPEPLITVLLGDSVGLSAEGSCSRRGQIRYQWEFDDQVIAATASPGAERESLTVFPAEPGDYQITLTVSDDAGDAAPISVVGIRAVPWQRTAPTVDVRDLAIGGDRIWIASDDGAQFIDLDDAAAGVQDLNPVADGEDVQNDLAAVHFATDTGFVWFGRRPAFPQIWRVTQSPLSVAAVAFPVAPTQTEVRDISSQAGGVAVATRDGVFVAPDNQTLAATLLVGDFFAVAENTAGGWAGGDQLFTVADGTPSDPFQTPDNKIRALAGDDVRVWAGSDDRGVARVPSSGAADIFTVDQGLPSNKIRNLVVDSEGDVWAATDQGVARYKRDRGVWVSMEESSGLEGVANAQGIAILEDGSRRLIVAGGTGGIAVLGGEGLGFPPP
jgi:hypothetical protein